MLLNKDLTELVLEEERDVDDEMADDDDDADGDLERDFSLAGKKVRDPSAFLNESFADSEDLDDEMDGEEDGGAGGNSGSEGHKDDDSSASSSGGAASKYSCSVCGESAFISKKSLRQHVR